MSKKIKVKPGKTQSKFSFFIGIIFCCIGLFIVIPTFGPFGLLWTGIALFITISHGMNAFGEKGISTYEMNIEEENTSSSVENRLKNLESLYNQRLITKEEYEMKRKDILNDI